MVEKSAQDSEVNLSMSFEKQPDEMSKELLCKMMT